MASNNKISESTTACLENPTGRMVRLGRGGRRNEILIFRSSAMLPARPVRLNYYLQKENADLRLLIFFIDDGPQQSHSPLEISLNIEHLAPRTTAKVSMRAIMDGKQSLLFPATVFVPHAAVKTDTHLRCDAMMLASGSSFRPIPALEILADDVKAGHAASSIPPDAESIFSLQTRGLSEKEAKKMLIESFLYSAPTAIGLEERDKIYQLERKIAGLSNSFML